MNEVNFIVFSMNQNNKTQVSLKLEPNSNLDDVREKLSHFAGNLRFFHKETYLRDPINWEVLADSRIPVIIINSEVPFPSIPRDPVPEYSPPSSPIPEILDKYRFNMQNLKSITKLFRLHNLSVRNMVEFAKLALNRQEELESNPEFDEILESPFIARLLKNPSVLKQIELINYR